jgi:phage repressor protein C with HTH and peptisase S24 domain
MKTKPFKNIHSKKHIKTNIFDELFVYIKKLLTRNQKSKPDFNITEINLFQASATQQNFSNWPFPLIIKQMQQCEFTLDKPNLFSFIIDSDNMEPTYQKNDIVMIDLDSQFSQDGVYAVYTYGRFSICRVQAMLNGFKLIHDNTKYESTFITLNDNFSIIGHLEWKLSKTYHS